jgi:BASS family bile acid:Na+ symporter
MIFQPILWLLSASGRHARILLPLGVVIALLLPSSGEFFKPATPFILAILAGAALVRLDIGAALKAALRPQRLFRNFAISLGLLLVLPVLFFTIAKWCGLPNEMLPLVTWYSLAPPVGTTIWICVLLGFTAPIAMEIVLLTNLLAPFTGPFLGEFLLGAAVPVSSAMLCLRIGAILGSGLFLALLTKHFLGEDRIQENQHQLDGVSTIAMLAFLLPVFDGIGVTAIATPFLACACLGLAFGLNFGTQVLIFIGSRVLMWCRNFGPAKQVQLPEGTRSVAVVAGNRNLGLYFAALPADPLFSLFVAAYQAPLYLTPMIAGWFADRSGRK